MTVAERKWEGVPEKKNYFSMSLPARVIAANHIRRKFHISERPAASSQEILILRICAEAQMTNWVNRNVNSQIINKAMAVPGGRSLFFASFLKFITFHNLVHALPGNIESIGDLCNGMAGAAHLKDFCISFVLLSRTAAEGSPGPTVDFH